MHLDPHQLRRFHGVMTVAWLLLILPGVALWRDSVPFLVAISIYANVAGHFGAWQASRAEEASE